MDPSIVDRSYRALLAVPSLGRVLLGMQLARIAQTMVSVVPRKSGSPAGALPGPA